MDPAALTFAEEQWHWLGNLYHVLPVHLANVVLVTVAIATGLIIGAEREIKRKPAGLRTLMLISTGACLYTIASLLIAGTGADPGRVAAQVVTGVGFLGAGVIIHERGSVLGLTTGATIWVTAAVGILAGAGYAAAALVMAVIVVTTLIGVGLAEERMRRRCRFSQCRVHYKRERGKTRVQILEVLDTFKIADQDWQVAANEENDTEDIDLRYCHYHAEHRAVLFDLARISAVREMERKRTARDVRGASVLDGETGTA